MTPLGFMGTILDVNLTTGAHRVRDLTQMMADDWLGGTGLGAHLCGKNKRTLPTRWGRTM